MTSSKKLPAMQWYPGDWRKDPGVQALDLEHRGAWWECLQMMWESSQRGRLVFSTGEPMDDESIARILGVEQAKWKQIRSKLVSTGVASEDPGDGVLSCRRMLRDENIIQSRREAGRKGGKSGKKGGRPLILEANGKQKNPPSSSSSLKGDAKASLVEVFEYWREKSGHTKAGLTEGRESKIRARLRRFSVDDLKRAIDGALADPFYTGKNDRGKRYDYPETILKNDETVERHIESAGRNSSASGEDLSRGYYFPAA